MLSEGPTVHLLPEEDYRLQLSFITLPIAICAGLIVDHVGGQQELLMDPETRCINAKEGPITTLTEIEIVEGAQNLHREQSKLPKLAAFKPRTANIG